MKISINEITWKFIVSLEKHKQACCPIEYSCQSRSSKTDFIAGLLVGHETNSTSDIESLADDLILPGICL